LPFTANYTNQGPPLEQLEGIQGACVVEFGTDWCGHCRAAQPHIAEAFQRFPEFRHIKVEDGPGRRLGRSFRVKLWPTLIFLHNGHEIARLVRPQSTGEIIEAMARISP
jgi:thioredoxin 1